MDKKGHHCGTCGCCGGKIPCGESHIRRWRSGECPGSINQDGNCGALISAAKKRKRLKPGACNNN